MINTKKSNILTRLLNLESQNFERQNSYGQNKQNEEINDDGIAGVNTKEHNSNNQIHEQNNSSNKAILKRNIFANTIINKNASKLVLCPSNNDQQVNILQSESLDDVMITDLERLIYEQLDKLNIRLADPMEKQNNYYQRVRTSILSSDDFNSERFLTPKASVHSDKDLETRESSQPLLSSDENIQSSKSADLKFNESKIYLKRSSFKRPVILQQYSKGNAQEQSC